MEPAATRFVIARCEAIPWPVVDDAAPALRTPDRQPWGDAPRPARTSPLFLVLSGTPLSGAAGIGPDKRPQ